MVQMKKNRSNQDYFPCRRRKKPRSARLVNSKSFRSSPAMRIPHTINANYFKEYYPSEISTLLIPDCDRVLKSEDETWDADHPARLTELCIAVIVRNFKKKVILSQIPCWDRNLLLETLPTDLPLPLVVQHIGNGIYWKRRVKERWKDEANYCQDYDSDWKRMYLEKHVQEAIEAMTPEGYDLESIKSLCDLTKAYVKRLDLRELQIKQLPTKNEEEGQEDELSVLPTSSDHINLGPIIANLENLTELHVQFGLRNIGSEYKNYYFQFSLDDCRNLGEGVNEAKNLKLFRVHSCYLDDDRLIALLSNITKNDSLEVINFSNCILGDKGASAIAKFMQNRERLREINLSNNRIGETGLSALAFMLTQSQSSPIENLNLRHNTFGDGGLKYLASALVRDRPVLRILNVSCCNLTDESAIYISEVLNRNSLLIDLDLSNNKFGDVGGRALESAVVNNTTVQFLDLRMTGVEEERLANIKNVLFFNRIRALKGERGVRREIRLIAQRAEEEKLRLERLAAEEARAAEEEAARIAAAEAAAKLAAEQED